MSKKNYESFRDGLKEGLAELWQPWFMSGVRNGGFEQTLRNVCMPHIEKATGRMAFTESRGRADLLLCDEAAELYTRCEFKVNFALQHSEILRRKRDAVEQVKPRTQHAREDGIIVYAIAELTQSRNGPSGKAKLHNAHVASTPYKQFQTRDASNAAMETVRRKMETASGTLDHTVPAFDALFDEKSLSRIWASNTVRLHVWTHHVTR